MHVLWFVPIAAMFAIASKAPAAIAMSRESKGFDNHNPRAQAERLTGWGRRAVAAHQNSMESFSIFSTCLLAGVTIGVGEMRLLMCCVIFIVCRLIYIYLYIDDKATLRSVIWAIGFFSSLAMPFLGLW